MRKGEEKAQNHLPRLKPTKDHHNGGVGPLGSLLDEAGAGEAPPRVGRTLGAAAPPRPPLAFILGRCFNAEKITTYSLVLDPYRP